MIEISSKYHAKESVWDYLNISRQKFKVKCLSCFYTRLYVDIWKSCHQIVTVLSSKIKLSPIDELNSIFLTFCNSIYWVSSQQYFKPKHRNQVQTSIKCPSNDASGQEYLPKKYLYLSKQFFRRIESFFERKWQKQMQ